MISYGQNALMKKQELQHAKDFMVLNLRKIKRLYHILRKAREGEGSRTFTRIKIRIYLIYSATSARNTVIIPVVVEVQSKGSMKLQLLM